MSDHHVRSVVKATSYRIFGTLSTVLISWVITRQWKFAVTIGFFEFFGKIIVYYLHERLWNRIEYGRKSRGDYQI